METELSEAEAVEEAGVATASRGTDSAVWRLTEGCSDATTSGRGAKGRLDFVLQVLLLPSLDRWLYKCIARLRGQWRRRRATWRTHGSAP